MKTIMHITEVLSGGVLPVIAGICNGLSSDYSFIVVYGLRFDTPQNLDEIFDTNVKLIPMPMLKLKMSIKNDLLAVKELRKLVKSEKPDIIHIHSTKAGIDARIGLVGFKTKKYYTPHGFCFLRKDQNGIKHSVLVIMEKFLTIFCDGIVACGNNEYEEAKKLTSKAFLINNGIDTKFIDLAEMDVDEIEHDYTIYTVGRIGPQKNPKLFNKIAAAFPNYRFVWIGDGECRDQLTSPNIYISGLLQREEVIKKAKNYDCYLSTSLWEGLPIALMEAMYMGKKCVVSDVEGNNELIHDGTTGFIYKDYNDACSMIKNGQDYGDNAREYIKEQYTIDVMNSKYRELYG